MAVHAAQRVALVSIHPQYAEAILEGTKRVEFRRSAYPTARYVAIYATAPVQRIIGWCEIDQVERASPRELWRRWAHLGAVDGDSFRRYYEDCSLGTALHISRTTRLNQPVSLGDFSEGLRPPQSYRYLAGHMARALGIPV